MASIQVCKFGGSSLGTPEAMHEAIKRVGGVSGSVVVVVSALGGVTNELLLAEKKSVGGDALAGGEAARRFRDQHESIIASLCEPGTCDDLRAAVGHAAAGIETLSQSLAIIGENTPRSRAQLLARGERLAAQLFSSALNRSGLSSVVIDATELIFVAESRGVQAPDFRLMKTAAAEKVRPALKAGAVVVIPGFIATDEDGHLTLLGRGGTDYSAALMANVLEAERLLLFKEVDGFMTADPTYVKEARVVPRLHYREAAELAYYGAKILHPKTMIPLAEAGIPLVISNTFAPKAPGTIVDAEALTREFPVKALTAITGQALITVEGKGMIGVPGIAGRTFSALARHEVSVSVISQASSESSICFVVPEEEQQRAKRALKSEFEWELELRLIDKVASQSGLATVAVVGLGMSGYPGIAARVFSAVAGAKINVVAIAQGSAEHNISLVIKESSVALALNALHDEFQLQKMNALATKGMGTTQVAIFGLGQIGRDLAYQMVEQRRYFRNHIGIDIVCFGAADRSGLVMKPEGFSTDQLVALLKRKEDKHPLVDKPEDVMHAMTSRLFATAVGQGILVDTTAADTAPLLMQALTNGFNLVLANKKPLAIPQADYDRLLKAAEDRDLSIRYEATVGAGLPIFDTLDKLNATGDSVKEIEGCLSGTLGFLFTLLAAGKPYSQAVREAYDKGYTEPDPRDDLDGMDVGRKALILARRLGYRLDIEDIRIEPLFPKELGSSDPQQFFANLKKIDQAWDERCRTAAKNGKTLRYMARISANGVSVGTEDVQNDSPAAGLKGTDNQVVIRTARYDTNPLVIKGPGAGASVTAQGVLNDIVAIAIGHRKRAGRSNL